MNLTEIFQIIETSAIVKSDHYFKRYKKLISFYYVNEFKKTKNTLGKLELHHILPKNIYPIYRLEKWNLVLLPVKAHYIAHYLLFKSLNDKSCIYAFNQMRRITKNTKPNCRLYANIRIEFSKLISINNTGRVNTFEHNYSLSLANKNKNTYRGPNNELKKFIVGTEPDGWEPFQTGRVRSCTSKNLMKNIMRDRIWQYNSLTKEVKFEKEIANGFEKGFPPWFTISGRLAANSVWIRSIISGENKRLKINEPMPDNFKFGRNFENKGFQKINNTGLIKVFDLHDKKFLMINVEELNRRRHITPGTSIDNTWVYRYNSIVYTTRNDLFVNNKHLPLSNGGPKMLTSVIPPPHRNQTVERQEFSKNNHGKTYSDIGVQVISVIEYIFKETEIYVRS